MSVAPTVATGPERTCVGCGRTRPKGELLRVVKASGRLVPDPQSRLPGRGAYVCKDAACMREATRRHGFERSFRAPVRAPDDVLDWTS